MRSKKALINIITSVILQITKVICGFIVPKLIISSFGSKTNGLVTSIAQLLGFVTLLEAGFGTVIKSMLYKPIANKDKARIESILKSSEKIFRVILYIFIVYFIILCIFIPLKFANEFDYLYTVLLIMIISMSTFAEYFFGITYTLFLQAEQKRYVVAVIQMGSLIINTIIVVVLVKIGANIHVVKLASSFVYLLKPILQYLYVKKKYDINLKKVSIKYRIKNKWDGLIQHIAAVVHNNTDIIILTLQGNLLEISVYSVYAMVIRNVKELVKSFTGGVDAAFGDMIAKNENDNLNKSFKIYEGFYFTVSTVIFSSTIFLIIPFIKVYTKMINDVDYIRPTFAIVLILAEFIAIIRQPYNDLIKVSGHFKETKVGALVETICNIIISFALVWKLGIVGVAIGTLVAMSIRAIDFVCYTSKNILKRSVWKFVKCLCAIILELIVIYVIINFVPRLEVNNYKTWVIDGILVIGISTFVVVIINYFVYKDSYKYVIDYLKNLFKTGTEKI